MIQRFRSQIEINSLFHFHYLNNVKFSFNLISTYLDVRTCVKILSSICLSRPRLVKEKRGGRATKKYKEDSLNTVE